MISGTNEWVLADLETGQITRGETGFDLFTLSVSPDHRRLAVAGMNGEVALVDAASGELVRPAVVAHARGAWWAAWSADGSRFATASQDGSVVLWDGKTGLPVGSVLMPEETLLNVAFLPDNETVLLAPYTDSFYRWDTNIDRAIEFACRAAAGEFDETHWEGCPAAGPTRRPAREGSLVHHPVLVVPTGLLMHPWSPPRHRQARSTFKVQHEFCGSGGPRTPKRIQGYAPMSAHQ